MKDMIEDYEAAWDAVQGRIGELGRGLMRPGLGNRERSRLEARRRMLLAERWEMGQILRDLRRHGEGGCG